MPVSLMGAVFAKNRHFHLSLGLIAPTQRAILTDLGTSRYSNVNYTEPQKFQDLLDNPSDPRIRIM